MQRRQDSSSSSDSGPAGLAQDGDLAEEEPLLLDDDDLVPWHTHVEEPVTGEAQSKSEHIRGEVFGVISICLIAFAWIFFITTAFLRLRAKSDREVPGSQVYS